ncbi:MAG: hypothetical protein WEE66_14465 [Actinomycetota bacterium]
MNEIERDLRDILERKAGSVGGVAPRLPEAVRKRGRRRQAGTTAIGAFTVAAVALVSFAGLRSIDLGDADGGVPADDPWAGYEVFERTATIENFTIASPSDWYLVNQWPLGAYASAGSKSAVASRECDLTIPPDGGEPRGDCSDPSPVAIPSVDVAPLPMFMLSSDELGLGASPCTTGDLVPTGDDAVLEVAIDPAVIDAREAGVPTSKSPLWPVTFDESATEAGSCGVGYYVHFEIGAYPYLAFASFGPDATDEDRRVLFDAFSSMKVTEWAGTAPSSRTPGYVIAGGESAAGPWRLELREQTNAEFITNVQLDLVAAEGRGVQAGGPFVVYEEQPIEQAGGDPTFGAVSKEADRVELRSEGGPPPVGARIVPLPPSMPFDFDLFFGSYDADTPATAIALDANGQPLTTTSILDEVTHLPSNARWAPPVSMENEEVVMPITFPDGATAELVYPADLALEELNFYPDTYGVLDGKSSSCGWPVHASRYDPRGGWVRGEEPLDRYVATSNRVVELWEGTRGSEPYNYLLSRSGSWNVIVPCDSVTTIAGDTLTWAELVTTFESPDGLLVLEDAPPLDMHLGHEGATVRISGADVVVDLSSGRSGCERSEPDLGAGDGVVQWCIEPTGGVYVYANAFKPAQESFLERLVADLRIRAYRPVDG